MAGFVRHFVVLALVASCAWAAPPQQRTTKADLTYVDSSFAAGAILRPRQAMQSNFGKAVIQNAFKGEEYEDLTAEFSRNFGVELKDVDQLTVLFREKTIASSMGIRLPTEGEEADVVSSTELTTQMKQIGLAFHNYYSVHNEFPPATGKLSWRVHMLPYLEQQELYEQFDLDEDWNSDTNKPLIEKMPDVFKAAGVAAKGKTSIHVFVGKDAPFEDPLSFRDIVDGTSNTILAVMAGADTATEWTKPGGLKINEEDPAKSFGDLKGTGPLVGMLDGSVRRLPPDLDSEVVKSLLTHAGGEPIDRDVLFSSGRSGPSPDSTPTLIAYCTVAIDQEKAIGEIGQGFKEPVKKRGNGKEYWDMDGYVIWFPDAKTLVATQKGLLPRMMKPRGPESRLRKELRRLGDSDVVFVGDAKSMPTVFAKMIEGAPLPNLKEINDATIAIDVTTAKQPLLAINVNMSNATSATGMQAMLGGALAGAMQQVTPNNAPPGMEGIAKAITGLVKGVKVERDEGELSYTVPKPANYPKFVDGMKPELKKLGDSIRGARTAAGRVVAQNSMRMIGLAFHNYHDVYNKFVAADGSRKKDKKGGLSWRVHLLPFLEQAALYQKFKMDEPWDSEHNKKLIAEMPNVFRSKGVSEEGKTNIHLVLGEDLPFGKGSNPPGIGDFIDGTSNTILVVRAGTDKAEIWTKPGGIEFDKENPIKTLGKIGDTFVALFADGSVHNISDAIDPDVLKALFTHGGREVIDNNDF